MSPTTSDGQNGTTLIKPTHLHAPILDTLAIVRECGSPQATRRTLGGAGLEVKCVIEWSRACEEDRCTAGVEEGIGEGKGWNMQCVEMWVGVSVDLSTVSGCRRVGRTDHVR